MLFDRNGVGDRDDDFLMDRNGVGDRDGDFLNEVVEFVDEESFRKRFFRFSRKRNNSVSDSLARLLSSFSLEGLASLSTTSDELFP